VSKLLNELDPGERFGPSLKAGIIIIIIMYRRMKISSCTGIAAYLRTKQYILIDLTSLL